MTIDRRTLPKGSSYHLVDHEVRQVIEVDICRFVTEYRAQVLEDTQGTAISPLLANVYLHYVYDLWVNQWRARHAQGDMIVVRFAHDTVAGFQHKGDGERFLVELQERLAEFALRVHPEKTCLIEFGKLAAERRDRRGEGKPETFDFLGFTHICGKKSNGKGFQLWR